MKLLRLWCPLFFTIACLALATLFNSIWTLRWLSFWFFGAYLIGLGVMFCLLIWQAIRRHWNSTGVFLLGLTVAVIAIVPAFIMAVGTGDPFANGLEIPEGIKIADALDKPQVATPAGDDEFRTAILKATQASDSDDVEVSGELSNLVAVIEQKRSLFERYLAASPAWRVFEVQSERFATRRWKVSQDWRYDLHGYYSDFDINGPFQRPSRKSFQVRCTLGLTGATWVQNLNDATEISNGQKADVSVTGKIGNYDSLCVFKAGSVVLEIFEQSESRERQLTMAALKIVDSEAKAVLNSEGWNSLVEFLPSGTTRSGSSHIELCSSFQPGIYDSFVWINPGEPGLTYLKAFEVTRNYQLSESRLLRYSNERVGWSDDASEQFFSNTHFTIFEGDWGQPYAARIEMWFRPDSGKPERKLIEKTFKIEGWQR